MTAPSSPRFLVAWALGAALVSGPVASHAADETPGSPPGAVLAAPAATPAATLAPATSTPVMSVKQVRGAIERGLTELGELAAQARQSGDMLRIACVQDKQDRADAVVEVATGDLVAAQDPAADAPTRAFASEKLGESTQQLEGLVSKARACTGKEEAARVDSSNDAQAPQVVLPQDPTSPSSPAARGLPPIDPRPPVASPVL